MGTAPQVPVESSFGSVPANTNNVAETFPPKQENAAEGQSDDDLPF